MKKSQIRANLLNENSVFPQQSNVETPPGNSSYTQNCVYSQQDHPSGRQHYNQPQPMRYVNHPLAQNSFQEAYYQPNQPIQAHRKQRQSSRQHQQPPPHHQVQPQPQQPPLQAQPPQHIYNTGYHQGQSQGPSYVQPQVQPSIVPHSAHSSEATQQSAYHHSYQSQQSHLQPQPQIHRGSHRSHEVFPVSDEQPYYQEQRGSYSGPYQSHPHNRRSDIHEYYDEPALEPVQPTPQPPIPVAPMIPPIQNGGRIPSESHSRPLRAKDQVFTIDSDEEDDKVHKSKSKAEVDKIQLLEEKIQRLERVLALQELTSKKSSNNINRDAAESSNNDNNNNNNMKDDEVGKEAFVSSSQYVENSKGSSINGLEKLSGPPLPPPPPPEKRSLSSSPKANLFTTENSRVDSHFDASMRMSASSLIPTDKSISDQSVGDEGDLEAEYNNDDDNDEPPPSYEELEKSGSLTYSQSIYRTGFEKAGYQMDHVATPLTPKDKSKPRDESDEVDKVDDETMKFSTRLMSKRKIPSQITDDMFEKAALRISSQKDSSDINNKHEDKVPAPRVKTEKTIQTPIKMTIQEPTQEPILTKTEESVRSKARSATKPIEPSNFIKYSTPSSYETLSNGVIQPILPSKCSDSVETSISAFRRTREKALADYKQFTPSIQFNWAILLLETLSKSEVISQMTIDGKIRKNPLPFKKLKKQRLMFLSTAIKVLEKLIQVAPNDTRARLYLGDIYSGGIHPGLVERDERIGYELFFESAMQQNDPVACYRIACCLESGVGCKQDIPKSILFFEKGATLGDPSSMCQLGMMHFAGVNGCIQDVSLSISYHKQAYETLRSKSVMGSDPLISTRSFQDARGALYTLAKLHQTDSKILCLSDRSDPKTLKTIQELKDCNAWCNKGKALKYYLEAAKLGHNESQACLGYYYSQGFFPTHSFKSDKESNEGIMDPIDARKSIYWFSKAAADGHTYAALGLARWYGAGAVDSDGRVILKRDEQQAFLWGRKAADGGELVEAEFMIGVCFEQGYGVEKNLVMAANYYERSAMKGYKKAIAKLKALR